MNLKQILNRTLPIPGDNELLNLNVARKRLITLNVRDIEDTRSELPDSQGVGVLGLGDINSIGTGEQGFEDDPLLNLMEEEEPEKARSKGDNIDSMQVDMEIPQIPDIYDQITNLQTPTAIRTPIGNEIVDPTFQPTPGGAIPTPLTGLPTPPSVPKPLKRKKLTIDSSTFITSE